MSAVPVAVVISTGERCDLHYSASAMSRWTKGGKALYFCGHCTGHGEEWSREGAERFLRLQSEGWLYHSIKEFVGTSPPSV